MSSNLTKGPWRVDAGRHGLHIRSASVPNAPFGGELVAEVFARADADAVAAVPHLLAALHQISLCSQNSASSKEECGRIARAALAAAAGGAA